MYAGRPTFIYVIEAQNGRIKIGASTNPQSRAAAFHLHSPIPCRLVAFWPGTMKEEQALHRRFGAHRLHCEWFSLEGPVLEFFGEVFGRGGVVEPWTVEDVRSREQRAADAARKRSISMKLAWSDPQAKAEWLAAIRRHRRTA